MHIRRFLAVTAAGVSSVCALGQPVIVEQGFVITPQASQIPNPTQIAFSPDGRLLVSTRTGTILAYSYDADGIASPAQTVAVQVGRTLLGIGFDSEGVLYASSNEGVDDSGFLARLRDIDADGFYETVERFVTNLPNAGHHNNQLAIDGHMLYVGMGSRTDDGQQDDVQPISAATILRIDLTTVDFGATTNLPEVHAQGFRNPFGITVDRLGRLWACDNGQDEPIAPEKLHLVEPGRHHGFPPNLAPPDAITALATLGLGTSADGLDVCEPGSTWGTTYQNNLFMVRFDYELNDPSGIGMDLIRVAIDGFEGPARPTVSSVNALARGFNHPLDTEFDPFGNLLVMEYGSYFGPADGALYRIARANLCEGDIDEDATVSLSDLSILLSHFGMLSNASCPLN